MNINVVPLQLLQLPKEKSSKLKLRTGGPAVIIPRGLILTVYVHILPLPNTCPHARYAGQW
jgi:hypothetical protein